jgi:hypothetical protein
MTRTAIVGITAGVLVSGIAFTCWPRASNFNAAKWKIGTKTSRGPMALDLIERRLLVGKSRAEILEMLGKPNECTVPSPGFPGFQNSSCTDPRVSSLGYKVITISRCYYWNCEMNVLLNPTTYLVEEVNISD